MKTTFALRRLEEVGDAGVCGHHDDLRLTRVGRRSRESPPSRPAPRPGRRVQLSRAGIHVNRMLRPSSGPHKGELHQVSVAQRPPPTHEQIAERADEIGVWEWLASGTGRRQLDAGGARTPCRMRRPDQAVRPTRSKQDPGGQGRGQGLGGASRLRRPGPDGDQGLPETW